MNTFAPAFTETADGTLRQTTISMFQGKDRPRFVTGLSKLIQQVTFLLLTEQDSIEGMPGIGASPMNSLGQFITTGDRSEINSRLATAAQDIRRQLSQLAPSFSVPEDEQLKDLFIEATGYDSNLSQLTVQVRVSSLAGDSAEYEIASM